jgi:rSAM/selenodomain-associated transferase 2
MESYPGRSMPQYYKKRDPTGISVIIPTYKEEGHIGTTVQYLLAQDTDHHIHEIIVADAASPDATAQEAKKAGAIVVSAPKKGRAAQMNLGASLATGDVLYFLHADTLPPWGFTHDIFNALKGGNQSGCFRLRFDVNHWFLKANCWFTRFNANALRFGDQSLFAEVATFKALGGFKEQMVVLEDQEIIKRLKRNGKFKVVKKAVTTSARKYLANGIYKTQAIFFLIYFMYRLGCSQQKLVNTYQKLIRQDKL